jgi:hypothetical protein
MQLCVYATARQSRAQPAIAAFDANGDARTAPAPAGAVELGDARGVESGHDRVHVDANRRRRWPRMGQVVCRPTERSKVLDARRLQMNAGLGLPPHSDERKPHAHQQRDSAQVLQERRCCHCPRPCRPCAMPSSSPKSASSRSRQRATVTRATGWRRFPGLEVPLRQSGARELVPRRERRLDLDVEPVWPNPARWPPRWKGPCSTLAGRAAQPGELGSMPWCPALGAAGRESSSPRRASA